MKAGGACRSVHFPSSTSIEVDVLVSKAAKRRVPPSLASQEAEQNVKGKQIECEAPRRKLTKLM